VPFIALPHRRAMHIDAPARRTSPAHRSARRNG
jgi:hypothetical protein